MFHPTYPGGWDGWGTGISGAMVARLWRSVVSGLLIPALPVWATLVAASGLEILIAGNPGMLFTTKRSHYAGFAGLRFCLTRIVVCP